MNSESCGLEVAGWIVASAPRLHRRSLAAAASPSEQHTVTQHRHTRRWRHQRTLVLARMQMRRGRRCRALLWMQQTARSGRACSRGRRQRDTDTRGDATGRSSLSSPALSNLAELRIREGLRLKLDAAEDIRSFLLIQISCQIFACRAFVEGIDPARFLHARALSPQRRV